MINTTIEYQRAVLNNREFCVKDKITFRNKKSITLSLDNFMKYSIREATSGAGKFEVGAAVIKEYTAILDNSDGRFDDYDFESADINAIVGLRLPDSSWESLDKGEYRIVKAVAKELTVDLKAYDNMLFFDKPYSKSKLTYPASIYSIIQNACNDCQVVVDASSVLMKNFMVSQRPGDKNITYRDVISYCAQIMGCYARIDHLNQLSFGWYDFGAAGERYDGGTFVDYTSGDQYDGGTFSNYTSGDDIDAGTFVDTDTFHHLYNISNQSVETGDIEITGVQIKVKTSGTEKEKIFVYGNEGYVIEISNNPMIDEKTASQVLSHIGPRLTGNRFRPMSISAQSNPAIESGDIAWVTDWKQRSFKTVLTSTDFVMGALQKIDCTAETPSEKEYTKYGAATKILSQAEENTENQLSAYDIAVQQMNQLAANTFGFFSTTVSQDDGSVIAYRHDKPTLAQSKTVYKSGIDGFWVTQNYTGNDATTAWKSGFDSSGNAVLNILSVIGINFSWAHGGTLKLGGVSNGNGLLEVYNASGTKIGSWGKDGISATTGTFSGNLSGAKGTFAGSLSAATGTFSGNLTAATGTFKGTVSAGKVTGSEIDGCSIEGTSIKGAKITGSSLVATSIKMEDLYFSQGGSYNAISATYNSSNNLTDINWGDTVSRNWFFGSNTVLDQDVVVRGNLQVNGSSIIEDTTVYGRLSVYGEKSRIVKSRNYDERLLYCYETPTPMFGDVGCGRLNEEGLSIVDIDPVFAETISGAEYQVFLQKEGPGDIWVEEKEPGYFMAKGTSDLKFSWEIKAIQRDYESYRLDEQQLNNLYWKDVDPYDQEKEEELEDVLNDMNMETDELLDTIVEDYDSEMEGLMDYEGS